MNADDKKSEIELKKRVSEELTRNFYEWENVYKKRLDACDVRLWEYITTVISDTEAHNLYELLKVKRFFDMLSVYGWNSLKVRKFFKFYECLKFNGINGRRRYKLTPVQCFQFGNIFGFEDKEGKRLTRTAYIFVPRKFSKTTSAAALAVYDMLFGDNNAQAFVGANSYSQAKICFDEIRAIIRDLDPNERHFKVNREKITFKGRGRESFISCLSGNARTQDGLNASLVIMDEYAQARDTANKSGADLKNVLTSSMGVRSEPLTVIISTASDVINGPFYNELESVKKILRGEAENDEIFADLFMPDCDDKENDPRTWRKVQPHLGVTVREDFYQKEWQSAQLSAQNMMNFRTKLLNVFTISEAQMWMSREKAEALLTDFNIDQVQGRPDCAVAFDLSVKDDFSAVSYTIYLKGGKFYTYTDYYFPDGALKGHPNEQLYRQWSAQGYLKLCKGEIIDVRMIADDILKRSKVVNIIQIGYDNWKSRELVNILSSVGGRNHLKPFSQTIGNFNLPVEAFEMLAFDDPPRIAVNNNPINAFCFTNCVLIEDNLENRKPMKVSQNRKIDGVITLLMTLGLMYSYER